MLQLSQYINVFLLCFKAFLEAFACVIIKKEKTQIFSSMLKFNFPFVFYCFLSYGYSLVYLILPWVWSTSIRDLKTLVLILIQQLFYLSRETSHLREDFMKPLVKLLHNPMLVSCFVFILLWWSSIHYLKIPNTALD